MDKKIIIGLLVFTGIAVGYYFYNKKTSVVKKDYNDKRMASEKEAMDFYNKITKEGQWSYSTQGIELFNKLYSENITKGKHNQMMDIFSKSKSKRSNDDSKIIEDNFNLIVQKLTQTNE